MAVLHMIIKYRTRVHTAWLSFSWRAHPSPRPTPQLNITVFLLDKTVERHEVGAHCCAVGSAPTVRRRPLCRLRIKSLSSITSGPRRELQVKAWELCPPSLNIAVGQLNSWYKALGGTWMKVKPASPRAPISLLYLLFRVKWGDR